MHLVAITYRCSSLGSPTVARAACPVLLRLEQAPLFQDSNDEILASDRGAANDMALDPGIGTCGKEGQGVPVGVGQPTIKVDSLTVGGTAV